jgi:hypothetical protein
LLLARQHGAAQDLLALDAVVFVHGLALAGVVATLP